MILDEIESNENEDREQIVWGSWLLCQIEGYDVNGGGPLLLLLSESSSVLIGGERRKNWEKSWPTQFCSVDEVRRNLNFRLNALLWQVNVDGLAFDDKRCDYNQMLMVVRDNFRPMEGKNLYKFHSRIFLLDFYYFLFFSNFLGPDTQPCMHTTALCALRLNRSKNRNR